MVSKWPARTQTPHSPTARARGLETRHAILQAAAGLFGLRGYETVTMRQIAGRAGCSHTAIYLYFKDKESLLEAIVLPALEELRAALLAAVKRADLSVEEKLLRSGHELVGFGLARRNLHRVLFAARASRVDVPQEEGSLNHTRIGIFSLLSSLCGEVLGFTAEDPRTLAAGRIFFFMLNGIIATYEQNTESTKALEKRLGDTFDLALRSCISGLKSQFKHNGAKGGAQ